VVVRNRENKEFIAENSNAIALLEIAAGRQSCRVAGYDGI
jgi:hypothetical protein